MPTGSVGHQENEKREEIQDEHNQHPPPPALPITEPPQLDTDENDCKKEKKILQVDNSNLIEEATRELDENGNELPKQIPFVEDQVKSEEHQQQEQQPSDKSKTNFARKELHTSFKAAKKKKTRLAGQVFDFGIEEKAMRKMIAEEEKTDLQISIMSREQMYKYVTVLQIAFSSVSLLVVCVMLPIMYNNVQTTIYYVDKEMYSCEMSNIQAIQELNFGKGIAANNRTRRSEKYGGYQAAGNHPYGPSSTGGGSSGGGDSAYDSGSGGAAPRGPSGGRGGSGSGAGRRNPYGPSGSNRGGGYDDGYQATGTPLQQECPGCCIPGPPGPRGPSGVPGKPGTPGNAGKPGIPGVSPNQTCPIMKQREPPPCRPCPKGPPGIKGWPGFPGDPGPVGSHGEKGKDGDDGEAGEAGPQGPPGFRGSPGPAGDKGPTPSGEVREGPPGDAGPQGPIGTPGVPGLPGRNGLTGPSGDRGWPGKPGETGEPGYPGVEGNPGAGGPPGQPGTCVCSNVDSVILVSPGAQPRIPEQAEVAYPSYSDNSGGGYGKK